MSDGAVVAFIFASAYLARIIAAAALPARRSRPREVADALALPLTMVTSKHKRGYDLSFLRVLLAAMFVLVWRVLDGGGHFTDADRDILIGIALILPVSDLFSAVPVREGLAALVAIFGSAVAKRTRRTETEEEETIDPAPGSAAAVVPPPEDDR